MLVEHNLIQNPMFNPNTTSNYNNDISDKIKNFIGEKKQFENILNVYKKKVLFPKEFIHDIGKISGLESFTWCIRGYNSLIIESRYLLKELKKVSSWGYIFNSYKSWFMAVNSIEIGMNKYQTEILNCIENKSELIIKSLLIKFDYSYWISKIIIFMSITKDSITTNKFICVRNFGSTQLLDELKLEQVKKLLPLFSNSKLIRKKDSIYYPISDLEQF